MSPSVEANDVERLGDLIWFAFGSGAGTLVSISPETFERLRQAYKSQIQEAVDHGKWPAIERQMLEFARAAGHLAAASAIERGSPIIEARDLSRTMRSKLGVYSCPLECDERLARI
jgi:hypothetical protein